MNIWKVIWQLESHLAGTNTAETNMAAEGVIGFLKKNY